MGKLRTAQLTHALWRYAVYAAMALCPVAIVIGYAFGVMCGFWQPFARPAGVPPNARYVSRFEDGTWFACHVDKERNVDVCRMWTQNGMYLGGGDFVLEDERRAATEHELKPWAAFPDGNGNVFMIYLVGGVGDPHHTLVPPGFYATVD